MIRETILTWKRYTAHIVFDYHTVYLNAWESDKEDEELENEAIQKLWEFVPYITKKQKDGLMSAICDIEINEEESL